MANLLYDNLFAPHLGSEKAFLIGRTAAKSAMPSFWG